MNIITGGFFKFSKQVNNQNVSALIKCLRNKRDIDLYKKWIAKEYNTNIEDEKVQVRLNLILELKDKVETIESADDKNQILEILSRLLSAKFSGSKQSDIMIELTLDKLINSLCFKLIST